MAGVPIRLSYGAVRCIVGPESTPIGIRGSLFLTVSDLKRNVHVRIYAMLYNFRQGTTQRQKSRAGQVPARGPATLMRSLITLPSSPTSGERGTCHPCTDQTTHPLSSTAQTTHDDRTHRTSNVYFPVKFRFSRHQHLLLRYCGAHNIRLFVCPSVCLSVTLRYVCENGKNISSKFRNDATIFRYVSPPNRSAKYMWGIKFSGFQPISCCFSKTVQDMRNAYNYFRTLTETFTLCLVFYRTTRVTFKGQFT